MLELRFGLALCARAVYVNNVVLVMILMPIVLKSTIIKKKYILIT